MSGHRGDSGDAAEALAGMPRWVAVHENTRRGVTARVTRITHDGTTWAVHLARTDLALPAPAPADLPLDVRAALEAWLRRDDL